MKTRKTSPVSGRGFNFNQCLGPFSPQAGAAAAKVFARLKDEEFISSALTAASAGWNSPNMQALPDMDKGNDTCTSPEKSEFKREGRMTKFTIAEKSKSELRQQLREFSSELQMTTSTCQSFREAFHSLKTEVDSQQAESHACILLMEASVREEEVFRLESARMRETEVKLRAELREESELVSFLRSSLEMASELEMGRGEILSAASISCQELRDAQETRSLRLTLKEAESELKSSRSVASEARKRLMACMHKTFNYNDLREAFCTWRRIIQVVRITSDKLTSDKISSKRNTKPEALHAEADSHGTIGTDSQHKGHTEVREQQQQHEKQIERYPIQSRSLSPSTKHNGRAAGANSRNAAFIESECLRWFGHAKWRNFELMANVTAGKEVDALGVGFKSLPPLQLVVHKVADGSWAALEGIREGDEVLVLNGHLVRNMTAKQFESAMCARPLRIKIWRSAMHPGNEDFFNYTSLARHRAVEEAAPSEMEKPTQESKLAAEDGKHAPLPLSIEDETAAKDLSLAGKPLSRFNQATSRGRGAAHPAHPQHLTSSDKQLSARQNMRHASTASMDGGRLAMSVGNSRQHRTASVRIPDGLFFQKDLFGHRPHAAPVNSPRSLSAEGHHLHPAAYEDFDAHGSYAIRKAANDMEQDSTSHFVWPTSRYDHMSEPASPDRAQTTHVEDLKEKSGDGELHTSSELHHGHEHGSSPKDGEFSKQHALHGIPEHNAIESGSVEEPEARPAAKHLSRVVSREGLDAASGASRKKGTPKMPPPQSPTSPTSPVSPASSKTSPVAKASAKQPPASQVLSPKAKQRSPRP